MLHSEKRYSIIFIWTHPCVSIELETRSSLLDGPEMMGSEIRNPLQETVNIGGQTHYALIHRVVLVGRCSVASFLSSSPSPSVVLAYIGHG